MEPAEIAAAFNATEVGGTLEARAVLATSQLIRTNNPRDEDTAKIAQLVNRDVQVPCDDDRPRAVDVTTLAIPNDKPEPFIVVDLWPLQAILEVAGEEGDGKTLLAEQICRQILRGEKVLGQFELGEVQPSHILFVDTEMERAEVARRCAELDTRGLTVEPDRLFWLLAGALDLATNDDDRAFIEGEIERVEAELLWIDAASNAISDSKDDVSVRAFFQLVLGAHARVRRQGDRRHGPPAQTARGRAGPQVRRPVRQP